MEYCIKMYQRAINRCYFLPVICSNNRQIRLFHVSSNNFIRKIISKCTQNQDEEYFEKNLDALNRQNSTTNFLGIEGDEGVIIIDAHKSSDNNMHVSLLQNDVQKKLKEKFYSTSFGIVRHDGDNMPRFHGQYHSSVNSVFPHKSTEHSEVQPRKSHPKKYDKFDTIHNDSYHKDKINFNYEQNFTNKLSINDDSNLNAVWNDDGIEKMNSNLSIYAKEPKDISYIDECFFDNTTEKEYSVTDPNNLVHELNYVDENYFGNYPALEKHKLNLPNIVVPDVKLDSNFETVPDAPLCNNSSFISDSVFLGSHKTSSTSNIENRPDIISKDAVAVHNNLLDENASVNTNDLNTASQILGNEPNKLNSDISIRAYLSNKRSQTVFKHSNARKTSLTYKSNVVQAVGKSNVQPPNVNLSSYKVSEKCFFEPSLIKTDVSSSKFDSEEANIDEPTAHDFVEKLREEQKIQNTSVKTEATLPKSEKVDSKGFRIYKNQVSDLSYFTRDEILNLLKINILYSDDDLLILNKPYGLIVHESKTTKLPCLSAFLDDLAKEINQRAENPKLLTVHRIDKETTGCLLLARNETMAHNLQSLFAQRKIIKKYWILTSKVPEPLKGVIDIPIAEGSVDNRRRMVLHPQLPKDAVYRNHSKQGKRAVTSYSVVSVSGNAALVEATPETGIKHQIRVHFGFGLSCPIVGDHKYSHLNKLAPQKLPSDILQKLYVRQSKVRHIPMHIHARSITIPDYLDGRNLFVMAPLPEHMKINLKRLRFRKKNKLDL